MGTAFLQCGSVREPSDEPPTTDNKRNFTKIYLLWRPIVHNIYLIGYRNMPWGFWVYLNEARAAGFALVWFFSWVYTWMGLQICRSVELSSTHIATIWFLPCNYIIKMLKCMQYNVQTRLQNPKMICVYKCNDLPVWTDLWLARFPL